MARVYSPFGPFLLPHQVPVAPQPGDEDGDDIDAPLLMTSSLPLHSRRKESTRWRQSRSRTNPKARGLRIVTLDLPVDGALPLTAASANGDDAIDRARHRPVSPVQRLSVLHRYDEAAGTPLSASLSETNRVFFPAGFSAQSTTPNRPKSRLERLRQKSDNVLFRDRFTVSDHEYSMPPRSAAEPYGVFNDEEDMNDTIPLGGTYMTLDRNELARWEAHTTMLANGQHDFGDDQAGGVTRTLSEDFDDKLSRLRAEERALIVHMWENEWDTIRGPMPKWYELKTSRFVTEARKDRLGYGRKEDKFLVAMSEMRDHLYVEHQMHRSQF